MGFNSAFEMLMGNKLEDREIGIRLPAEAEIFSNI
jgi:hypothetical protein